MKGQLDLMSAAQGIQSELLSVPDMSNSDDGVLSAERKAVQNAKKAALMVTGGAVKKYMQKLEGEQEILMKPPSQAEPHSG